VEPIKLVTARRVILRDEKRQMAEDFGAMLVDMEAATVARLARVRDIPFYCYKAVSDSVDDALPDLNRYITPKGEMRTKRFAAVAMVQPRYWPALLRMGKNSSVGAAALADDVRKLQREMEDAHGT
jgi:adenosylhomocysteine nucleosidase